MTYRLTGHLCNDLLIVGAPEEMGPAKGTVGSHLPVAPEKLVSPQSTNTHTNKHQYARQSLTKAKLLKKTVQKILYATYYLEEI